MNFPRSSFRKRWRALLVQLPMLAVMACSDSTGVDPYIGFYDMQRFAGKDLPSDDGTLRVRSGVIELRSGGRFQLDMDTDYNYEDGWKQEDIRHNGNYTISGGFITLDTGVGLLTGTIFPTYFLLNDGNSPSMWVKRD